MNPLCKGGVEGTLQRTGGFLPGAFGWMGILCYDTVFGCGNQGGEREKPEGRKGLLRIAEGLTRRFA